MIYYSTNIKKLFDDVAKKLQLKSYEDWYRIEKGQITTAVGGDVLKPYGNSLIRALMDVYPDEQWQLWEFSDLNRWDYDQVSNFYSMEK